MENSMQAMVLGGIGETLRLSQIALPALNPEEALVRVRAAALNRRDWWIQQGQYAGLRFPIILGSDGAGTVAKVGDESRHGTWIGKEVMINPSFNWTEDTDVQPVDFSILGLPENGTLAEYVRVPVSNLFIKPDYLTFEEAAAIPLGGLTAYRALFKKGGLKSGERVLISGVGGGVATFLMQWAKYAGAEVYVTSGSDDKIKKAIDYGASFGVNYREKDWYTQLNERVSGFDLIVDSALGEGFQHFLELAAPGGRIVFFGGTQGNIPELNGRRIFWKQLQIKGTTMGSAVDFQQMMAFIQQYEIKPIIDKVLPFHDAQKGFDAMADSVQFGKIVIRVGDQHTI